MNGKQSGNYKYLVMPYGLANAQSLFQAFVNEVILGHARTPGSRVYQQSPGLLGYLG